MLAHVPSTLYAGTPVQSVPTWVADIWRVIVWAWMLLLIGRFVAHMRTEPNLTSVGLSRIALTIVFARLAWGMAHNLGEPMTWEGLPITSIILALCWVATLRYERPSGMRH